MMMEEMDNRSIISNGSGMERSFSNGRYHQFHGKFMTDQNHNYSESEEKGSLSEEQGSTSSDLELREKLRQSENEKLSVIMDHNSMMRKCNERIDTHLREIQILEEHNKNLQTDLGEMRELCCYLDDDRKKCRQVAKEWQRFGRYTVTVMRNEVLAYSEKLKNLEQKQTDLMKENGELRDLCVYLDQSRKNENDSNEGNLLNFVICSDCKKLRKENEDTGLSAGVQPAGPDKSNRVDQSESPLYEF